MFHLKSDKKNNLQSRIHQVTIDTCDKYAPNNRPSTRWRVRRWEMYIGLGMVLFKMSTDQDYARSRVKGVILPPINSKK